MPCYRPLQAWRGKVGDSGKRSVVFKRGEAAPSLVLLDMKLPCGSCVGCRLERARQWAMRCMDEASLYEKNSFVTLTFDDYWLKRVGPSLRVSVFQRFMKRLRKAECGKRVRYFHCGEYGPKLGRPHYHALLFNVGFDDRVYFKTTGSGEKIYTSERLNRLWKFGYSSVGDVTFGSAAYVARYHIKKVGSVVSDNHYCNPVTGEVLEPEYVTMSRRPGIGKGFYDRFKLDMYPSDFRIIAGVKVKPARFYDDLYELDDPIGFEKVKCDRVAKVDKLDNDSFRLAVKEEVKELEIKRLKNGLEE